MNRDDGEMMALHLRQVERELHALKAGQLDDFAKAALSGLCAATPGLSPITLAEKSYKIADAMAAEKRSRAGLPLIV